MKSFIFGNGKFQTTIRHPSRKIKLRICICKFGGQERAQD